MLNNNSFSQSATSVDNVIFGFEHNKLNILLIKRKEQPFLNQWALPGDLVFPDEDLDVAPQRILEELTGLKDVFLEQVHTFGNVGRHPLGRVFTVAYYSLIKPVEVMAGKHSFAEKAEWHDVKSINKLAYDHEKIIEKCLQTLRRNIQVRPMGFELLPEQFALSELQSLYEVVLDKELDKRNFRKKVLAMNILMDGDTYQQGVAHRPAKLYFFDKNRYEMLKNHGFSFAL